MAASRVERDRELQKQLKEFGIDARPLTDSTRPVYQKKLQTLISGRSGSKSSEEDTVNSTETRSVSSHRRLPIRNSRRKSTLLADDSMEIIKPNIVPESARKSGRRSSRHVSHHDSMQNESLAEIDKEDYVHENDESALDSTTLNDSSLFDTSNVSYNNVSLQTSFSPVNYATFNNQISPTRSDQSLKPVHNSDDICDLNSNDYKKESLSKNRTSINKHQTVFREPIERQLFSKASNDSDFYSKLKMNLRHPPPFLQKKLSVTKPFLDDSSVPSSQFIKPKSKSSWLSSVSSYLRYPFPSSRTPVNRQSHYNSEFSDCEDVNGIDANYISNLNPKLLAKSRNLMTSKTNPVEVVNKKNHGLVSKLFGSDLLESDKDIPNGYSTSKYTQASKKLSSNSLWNSHVISKGLLVILAIFFCTIGIIYMNMKNQPNLMKKSAPTKDTFPICSNKLSATRDCIDMKMLKETISLLGSINKLLESEVNEATNCRYFSDGGYRPNVTATSIKTFISQQSEMFKSSPPSLIDSVILLIKANPHLNILVDKFSLDSGLELYFSIEHPGFGFMCHFWDILLLCSSYFIYFASMVIILRVLFLGYFHYKSYRNRYQEEVFELVQQILELLIQQYKQYPNHPYLVINHVRDQLFSPKQRKEKSNVWNAAVKYLANEDSRVREEVLNVKGEDYKVWHWISSSVPSARCQNGKVWQGRAFENSPLTSSLTSCLKIRNMFDSEVEFGTEWVNTIQDAILEKCERIPILHIFVDKVSKEGCVYIKCQSDRDAGLAFQALHGWYFDGSLITVKYLRVERYHERFPLARSARMPLRPSNDQKLSLQGPKTNESTVS